MSTQNIQSIQQALINVFYDVRVGGEEGLINWILSNPKNKELYYKMMVSLIPKNLTIQHDLGPMADRILAARKRGGILVNQESEPLVIDTICTAAKAKTVDEMIAVMSNQARELAIR